MLNFAWSPESSHGGVSVPYVLAPNARTANVNVNLPHAHAVIIMGAAGTPINDVLIPFSCNIFGLSGPDVLRPDGLRGPWSRPPGLVRLGPLGRRELRVNIFAVGI